MDCDATEPFFRDEITIPTNRKLRRGTGRFGKDVSAKTFRQRRFGKDISAKKFRDVSANFSCRNVPYYLGPVLSWFCVWFSTNCLGVVCRIPVCRILELKKNDKTINVGMMESIKRSSDGKWSLGLMPFGLKSFGLIQLVTWLNFFKLKVSGIGHLAQSHLT